jgi:hypothetical protein
LQLGHDADRVRCRRAQLRHTPNPRSRSSRSLDRRSSQVPGCAASRAKTRPPLRS